jgi:hypothetical protein
MQEFVHTTEMCVHGSLDKLYHVMQKRHRRMPRVHTHFGSGPAFDKFCGQLAAAARQSGYVPIDDTRKLFRNLRESRVGSATVV